MFFFLYLIQIQIDLNPWGHWGATTQAVDEKSRHKSFFLCTIGVHEAIAGEILI